MPRPRAALLALAIALALAAPGLAAPRCAVCPRPLDGAYRYYEKEGQKVCFHPDDPKPPTCKYCGGPMARYSPWGQPVRYADGRIVCNRCFQTSINEQGLAQATADGVRAVMERWGMKFPWRRIPVVVTGESTLMRLTAGEGMAGGSIAGVCQPTFLQSRPGGPLKVVDIKLYMRNGLPRLWFQKTCAHELMHAWQALHGCSPDQSAPFREGAANLAAYYFLQTRGTAEANELMHLMMTNPDPVYGEGFRRHVRYATDHRIRGTLALLPRVLDFPAGY